MGVPQVPSGGSIGVAHTYEGVKAVVPRGQRGQDTTGRTQVESGQFIQFFNGIAYGYFFGQANAPHSRTADYGEVPGMPISRFDIDINPFVPECRKGRVLAVDPGALNHQVAFYMLDAADGAANGGVNPVVVLVVEEYIAKMIRAGNLSGIYPKDAGNIAAIALNG